MSGLFQFTAEPAGSMAGVFRKNAWSEVEVAVSWSSYLSAISFPGGTPVAILASEWLEQTETGIVFDREFVSAGGVASAEFDGETAIVENRCTFSDGSRDAYRIRVVLLPDA